MTSTSPEFGLFLIPEAASHPELLRQVAAAERGGLDLIGIQDHPYQRRFLDTFALIADLLARTERLRIFPDVANLPLRPPAMLAQAGAIRRILNIGGTITDGAAVDLLHGPPEHWIETLTGFADELRFDGFVFSPAGDVLPQVERFAAEIVPAVRANLKRV